MTQRGTFHLYFNRHGAYPLMWCVSPESRAWEIAVSHVLLNVPSQSVYRPKETADEDDGKPSAWIAFIGELTIDAAGVAVVVP